MEKPPGHTSQVIVLPDRLETNKQTRNVQWARVTLLDALTEAFFFFFFLFFFAGQGLRPARLVEGGPLASARRFFGLLTMPFIWFPDVRDARLFLQQVKSSQSRQPCTNKRMICFSSSLAAAPTWCGS